MSTATDTWAIELHDTEVLGIRREGNDIILELSAYLHSSTGVPGVDAGSGWTQQAELRTEDARLHEGPKGEYLWILGGSILVDGVLLGNVIPLPFDRSGLIRLEFQGADGALRIEARRARLALLGEPEFVETFEP